MPLWLDFRKSCWNYFIQLLFSNSHLPSCFPALFGSYLCYQNEMIYWFKFLILFQWFIFSDLFHDYLEGSHKVFLQLCSTFSISILYFVVGGKRGRVFNYFCPFSAGILVDIISVFPLVFSSLSLFLNVLLIDKGSPFRSVPPWSIRQMSFNSLRVPFH